MVSCRPRKPWPPVRYPTWWLLGLLPWGVEVGQLPGVGSQLLLPAMDLFSQPLASASPVSGVCAPVTAFMPPGVFL